ncbi:MAG: flavodoxin [Lachnospiraceae bacterium]|nr:flavodoxin [Lachnospiraceae bacterium]
MKMKKIVILFMSLILILGLVACGDTQQEKDSALESSDQQADEPLLEAENFETGTEPEVTDTTDEPASDTEAAETAGEPDSASETTENGTGKTLVVYYSASGNTEEVAGFIAAATNADLFELEPTNPYSSDDLNWTDDNSRVVYEHEHPDDRDVELVTETVPDWESYDTVFIGYPIWWGIAAWPIDGFIKANDFTGKTVVPFCTSASSGLGDSGKLLEEMAGTGNWLTGERFPSGVSEETVQAWVEGMGL